MTARGGAAGAADGFGAPRRDIAIRKATATVAGIDAGAAIPGVGRAAARIIETETATLRR